MIKKQVLRCIGFMLCLVMLTVLMCDLFESTNNSSGAKNMYGYRNLPKNSINAVFLGTSGVDRYWVAPKAYEEYGIALYNLSFAGFPAWLYTDILDEILPQQEDIELILFDLRPFYQNNTADRTEAMDARAREYLDSLPVFNLNRIKTAFKTMNIVHEADEEKPKFDGSYLLSFIKFHSNWSDDYSLYDNLGHKDHNFGSFFMKDVPTVKRKEIEKKFFEGDYYRTLDPIAEKALYELIDYIKANDLEVLFVDTPQFIDKRENGRANTVYSILEANNLNYLTFYKPNSEEFTINLDNKKDFYDRNHVNYYGAEKFTKALAEYIDGKYELPDARENPNANEYWDGLYDKVKKEVKYFEKLKAESAKTKK